jgi:hypothetical protein
MATQRRRARTIALDFQRRPELERLKSGILLLLGAWIAYFFVVELLVWPVDWIVVPALDLSLSTAVVTQGLICVFVGALYLAARTLHKPDR